LKDLKMAVIFRMQRQAKRFQDMRLLNHDRKSHSGELYINVTALVDMMTVLVIFLVMQFNASGDMLFVNKDLKLPDAKYAKDIIRAPIVSLSAGGRLYFEGNLISGSVIAEVKNNDWKIKPLERRLLDNRKKFEALSSDRTQLGQAENDLGFTVNIQIDKSIPYKYIKYVLYTCETAGYNKIRFVTGDDRPSTVKLNGTI
jgi:biopolymer transport protein ExbD